MMLSAVRRVFSRNNEFSQAVSILDAPLVLLAGMSFVSQLGIAVMLPLIPLYATSLGATPWQLGLLTSAFAVTSSIGQLASGVLIDRFGARRFIRAGIALYAGANVLIATAFDAISLIAYRSVAGIGGGTNLVASRVYLSQIADQKRMAFVNGVLSAASSAGMVAGPAVGGIIAALSDLRMPFILVGATSGLSFLGSLFLPRPKEIAPSQPDEISESGLNRAAVILLVSQLFLLAGYGAFITTYAPLATQVLGWSTLEVGIVFSVFGLGSIALGPLLSHLADRYSRRRIAILSPLPVAFFAVALVLALPRIALYPITFISGAGWTAYAAAWFALLSEASPNARRGRTFGIVNAVSQLGIVVGAMLASVVWQSTGLGAAMMMSSIAILLGAVALVLMPRKAREVAAQ